MEKTYAEALNLIDKAQSVAIFTHANVDGDAIGSAFAFYLYLKSINKKVSVFTKTTMPTQLKFLNVENLLNKKIAGGYDLAIAVDCNTVDMMNIYGYEFKKYKKSIQFDHHQGNEGYASVNIINSEASSACEVVAEFMLNSNIQITDEIAKMLITGIVTDSGGFKFSCTSNKTMEIVCKLLNQTSIKISDIMANVFESEEPEYLQLYKEAINNTKLLENNRVALIVINNDFYAKTGIDPNSAKNLTRIGTEIKSVVVTALIAEVEKGVCKISFRSRRGYNCRNCALVFGGGGHIQASGCKIYGDLNTTIERVVKSMTDGLS